MLTPKEQTVATRIIQLVQLYKSELELGRVVSSTFRGKDREESDLRLESLRNSIVSQARLLGTAEE